MSTLKKRCKKSARNSGFAVLTASVPLRLVDRKSEAASEIIWDDLEYLRDDLIIEADEWEDRHNEG